MKQAFAAIKPRLAALLAGATLLAATPALAAGRTTARSPNTVRPAASRLNPPSRGTPRGPRVAARLARAREWAAKSPSKSERHLERLARYESKQQKHGVAARIEPTLMLKWVAGAAVGLVAFQILPVWPLVKLAASVAVAVGGAVYLPPALEAWRAYRDQSGGEVVSGSGARAWWDAYRSALAEHKQVTLPHLRAWAAQGSTLVSGGLQRLGEKLLPPTPAAAQACTTSGGNAASPPSSGTTPGSSS